MSSHHFVKENQEPALLILDAISFRHAESFLEWSPMVMVHERAIDEVLSWGIKIDVALGDQANAAVLAEKLQHQYPVKILTDLSNDLRSALFFLIQLRQTSVYIMTNDVQLILTDDQLPVNNIHLNLVTPHWRWSYVPSGNLVKWLTRGSELKFSAPSVISDPNLTRREELFEATNDGTIEIHQPQPFWFAEPLDLH